MVFVMNGWTYFFQIYDYPIYKLFLPVAFLLWKKIKNKIKIGMLAFVSDHYMTLYKNL